MVCFDCDEPETIKYISLGSNNAIVCTIGSSIIKEISRRIIHWIRSNSRIFPLFAAVFYFQIYMRFEFAANSKLELQCSPSLSSGLDFSSTLRCSQAIVITWRFASNWAPPRLWFSTLSPVRHANPTWRQPYAYAFLRARNTNISGQETAHYNFSANLTWMSPSCIYLTKTCFWFCNSVLNYYY